MPFSNDFLSLLTAAEAYTAFGYSVIPLLADRDLSRPKVPAVPWAAFQHRRPHPDELRQWFLHDSFTGIGLVTGRISRLVVLDFDTQNILEDFRTRCPDLMATRTVRSAGRGLLHLYFHLPSHLSLPSQKGQGIDLLSDGRYVVAPPTSYNGNSYQIIRGGVPKLLTEHDTKRILAFLRTHTLNKTSSTLEIGPPRIVQNHSGQFIKPTRNDLQALYQYLTHHQGRNEALFRTSLHARDHGWNEIETRNCLVEMHVQQRSSNGHQAETHIQRQREAQHTIRSAFSRPARRPAARTSDQLSNSVREGLLQQKLTYVVRTLEGLLQSGCRPGQIITAEQAIRLLKGLVGRDSIYQALKATTANGQPYFSRVSPPRHPPQDAYASAKPNQKLKSKKCFFDTEQKSGIIRRGPQNRLFRIPHNLDLCRLLGVRTSVSDRLERHDLVSARQTRMALHRELIKRRPGAYPRRWLARRLGVTRRTLDTYNRLIPIHSRPQYLETSLNWGTIEHLPLDEALPGAFIENLTGQRYPALRPLAARLLAKGKLLRLKERTANLYWYGTDEPPPGLLAALHQPPERPLPPEQELQTFIERQPARHNAIDIQTVQSVPVRKPVSKKQVLRPPNFHRPLADTDQESRALQLYDKFSQTSGKQLSLANARRLVHAYGTTAISSVLNLISSRKQVINPVGFLVTALRSASKLHL